MSYKEAMIAASKTWKTGGGNKPYRVVTEEQANEIAEAIEPGWNDEQADTMELIEGMQYKNITDIVNEIMKGYADRLNVGWGIGAPELTHIQEIVNVVINN